MFASTGHKKVQLRGNAENVCSGRLEILQNGNGDWSSVSDLNPTQANVYCKQMFCGTSASYTNSTSSNDAVELNCTGKSV